MAKVFTVALWTDNQAPVEPSAEVVQLVLLLVFRQDSVQRPVSIILASIIPASIIPALIILPLIPVSIILASEHTDQRSLINRSQAHCRHTNRSHHRHHLDSQRHLHRNHCSRLNNSISKFRNIWTIYNNSTQRKYTEILWHSLWLFGFGYCHQNVWKVSVWFDDDINVNIIVDFNVISGNDAAVDRLHIPRREPP